MINGVIRWCLNNHFLVFFFTAIIAVLGWYCLTNTPVDAIPDIGEKQVIVFTDWPGRSPQDVEDQVTYPLDDQPARDAWRQNDPLGVGFWLLDDLRDLPATKIDYYWARSRVLERMNVAEAEASTGRDARSRPGRDCAGPDSTGTPWKPTEPIWASFARCRTGTSATSCSRSKGFPKLPAWADSSSNIRSTCIPTSCGPIASRCRKSTRRSAAATSTSAPRSSRTTATSSSSAASASSRACRTSRTSSFDRRKAHRSSSRTWPPCSWDRISAVACWTRRAAKRSAASSSCGTARTRCASLNGSRQRSRRSNRACGSTLADGRQVPVQIVPFYDRTDIVHETMDTLREALLEEALVGGVIVVIFLLHLRSSLTILPTLPLSVAMSFIVMYYLGIDSNIMSLAGIAIAIGDVADMGIIMTENIYRRAGRRTRSAVREPLSTRRPPKSVRPIVTAVSNTIVSFIPVFALTDQEGKLFKPLAYTKTFAISASVILALTLVPVLCYYLLKPTQWSRRRSLVLAMIAGSAAALITQTVMLWQLVTVDSVSSWPMAIAVGFMIGAVVYRMGRERLLPLEENVVARAINAVYRPSLRWVLEHKIAFLTIPTLIALSGIAVWQGFDEGCLSRPARLNAVGLYPETTVPWQYLAARFPGNRSRVHAAAGRGFVPVHAIAAAVRLAYGSAGGVGQAGSGDRRGARSRQCRGQNRPGRIGTRSGADRHDRNDHSSQA